MSSKMNQDVGYSQNNTVWQTFDNSLMSYLWFYIHLWSWNVLDYLRLEQKRWNISSLKRYTDELPQLTLSYL